MYWWASVIGIITNHVAGAVAEIIALGNGGEKATRAVTDHIIHLARKVTAVTGIDMDVDSCLRDTKLLRIYANEVRQSLRTLITLSLNVAWMPNDPEYKTDLILHQTLLISELQESFPVVLHTNSHHAINKHIGANSIGAQYFQVLTDLLTNRKVITITGYWEGEVNLLRDQDDDSYKTAKRIVSTRLEEPDASGSVWAAYRLTHLGPVEGINQASEANFMEDHAPGILGLQYDVMNLAQECLGVIIGADVSVWSSIASGANVISLVETLDVIKLLQVAADSEENYQLVISDIKCYASLITEMETLRLLLES